MSKSLDYYEIEILNWEKQNPRKDAKRYSWFRFENDFFKNDEFFHMSHTTRSLLVFLMCEVSQKNVKILHMYDTYLKHVGNFRKNEIKNGLEKLNEIKLITCKLVRGSHVTRTPHVTNSYPTNRTKRDTYGDVTNPGSILSDSGKIEVPESTAPMIANLYTKEFNEFWNSYGRRGDKRAAYKEYCALRLNYDGLEVLRTAITNYCRENELKFRLHFNRFLKTDFAEKAKPVENFIRPKTKEELFDENNLRVLNDGLARIRETGTLFHE